MTATQPELTAMGPERFYLDGLKSAEWKIQCCNHCGHHLFPPRQYCPDCETRDMTWIVPAGSGVVYSTTVVRLDPKQLYNVSLIQLDEGIRMMSTVEGIEPGSVKIGMRVQGRIEGTGEQARVVFHPLEKEA